MSATSSQPRGIQKRCFHACDSCKRKKDRCDGRRPCGRCSKRKDSCRYSNVPAKTLAAQGRSNGSSSSIESPPPAYEAPVPQTARFLSDGSGRYNYIGDSASLSFLQSVKLVVGSVLGECEFSTSEWTTPLQVADKSSNASQQHVPETTFINSAYAEHLANEYLVATGCLLDLFDARILVSDVRRWAEGHPTIETHQCLVLLVLSVGLEVESYPPIGGSQVKPETLFNQGRQLAHDMMADEPSVLTVQAFALISMYLLVDSRTNAAFMNLGVAIRAADTLGLHRNDHDSFSEVEATARERALRSIRVLDIFLSASTGRPPATSDLEKDLNGEASTSASTKDEMFSKATLVLCAVGERILLDVYKKRKVSTALVEDIAGQIREWVSALPQMPAALELQTASPDHLEGARLLASAHLMGAYYWAIILLTRPFLLFHVSMQQAEDYQATSPSNAHPSTLVASIAETCIVAAINGLDLVEDVLSHDRLPKKLPVILNSVLNCALAVGIAVFAGYDENFPLISNMQRAITALEKLGKTDQIAIQYLDLVRSFSAAIDQYKAQKHDAEMRRKRKQFDAVFGAVDSRFACTTVNSMTFLAAPSLDQPFADDPNDFSFWLDDGYATIFPMGLLLSRPGTSHGMRSET